MTDGSLVDLVLQSGTNTSRKDWRCIKPSEKIVWVPIPKIIPWNSKHDSKTEDISLKQIVKDFALTSYHLFTKTQP